MKQYSENLPTLSTTTKIFFEKIRGFTVDLLFHLKNRELRVMDLVDLTGKYHQYVNRYLWNMRNYGLTEKNGSYWKLTEIGSSFLSYLESLQNDNIIIRKKEERKKKEGRKKEESSYPKKTRQISFSLWLQNSHRTLDEAETVVVEVLVDHYNMTGSKFVYCKNVYEIAEKFKIRPDQVNQVLMNLKQDHIVYNYLDKSHNALKIGLYKAFVENLKASKEFESSHSSSQKSSKEED